MSRIEDAEVFVAVVDAGGFTAASAALGVSQPAVSRRVAGLEARLGVRLLTRAPRGLRPTAAGAAFYERARRALGDLAEAERDASGESAELAGSLRVAAPPAFGRTVLLPHLAAFAGAHPQITVDLLLGERRLDLVEESIDLAVRIGDPGRAPGAIHTRLTDFGVVACAAPSYLELHGTPRDPADLARHACLRQIGPARGDVWSFAARGIRVRRAARPRPRTSTAVRGPLRSNDVEGLVAAARAGMGIGLLPDFLVAGDLGRGTLRQVLAQFPVRRIEVFAVYPERRHLAARTRALLDFLAARLRPRRRS